LGVWPCASRDNRNLRATGPAEASRPVALTDFWFKSHLDYAPRVHLRSDLKNDTDRLVVEPGYFKRSAFAVVGVAWYRKFLANVQAGLGVVKRHDRRIGDNLVLFCVLSAESTTLKSDA